MKQVMGKIVLVSLVIMCLGVMGQVYGEEWTTFGPRAQAMGGAAVGQSDSNNSYYYNPAAMAQNKKIGVSLAFNSTTSAEGDVLGAVDAIATTMEGIDWTALSSKIDSGQSLSITEVQQLLKLFGSDMTGLNKPAQGILFNLAGGASVTFGNTAVFGNYFIYGGGDPVFDLGGLSMNVTGTVAAQVQNVVGSGADHSTGTQAFTNPGSQTLADSIATGTAGIFTQNQAEELAYQAELAGIDTSDPAILSAILQIAQSTSGLTRAVMLPTKATTTTASATQNQSGLYMSGLMLKEMGISYGKPLLGDFLSVGGNIKMMEGQTYYNFIKFDQLQGGNDTLNDILKTENLKSSTAFGLDVAALITLPGPAEFKGGIVIRNINKPKFTFAGSGDFELDPQIRLGVSLNLISLLRVTLDYDVTKNKSQVLNGYESQQLGIGAEINLWLLKVRAGMQKNMASDLGGQVITAGLGLHLIWLDVDLAGALSMDESSVSATGSDTVPQRLGLALAASLKF